MSNASRAHIGRKVIWFVVGAVTVVVVAIVVTGIVDGHDDGVGNGAGTESDSAALYPRLWEGVPKPCGEILNLTQPGEELGDLQQLGMLASVSGLPAIHSSRFQSCTGGTGIGMLGDDDQVEAALSFLINDNLTLVISNSDYALDHLVDDLGLITEPTELRNDAHPDSHVRSAVYRNDPTDDSPVTGSSSFSIKALLTKEE